MLSTVIGFICERLKTKRYLPTSGNKVMTSEQVAVMNLMTSLETIYSLLL